MSRIQFRSRFFPWLGAAATVLIAAAGCTSAKLSLSNLLPDSDGTGNQQEEVKKGGPTKVVTDASAIALQLPESDLEARARFAQKFASLLGEGRRAAAEILVARHPDYAYEILTSQQSAERDTLLGLAIAYDRFCRTGDGWQRVASAARTDQVRMYFDARSQWMGAVASGRFEDTAAINLVDTAAATNLKALLADAWYQTGIGALLRGDDDNASKALTTCTTVAGDEAGMLSANAMLVCSEARRRAGDFAGATAAWQQSVVGACRVLSMRAVSDPSYWERASYLQPVGTAWPSDVAGSFQQMAQSGPGALRTDLLQQLTTAGTAAKPVTPTCWVLAAIGSWRHQRGETHQALIKLKKAEAVAESPAIEWLRIAQARELLALGQSGTSITVLSQIAAKKDSSPAMFAAMAELGVIRMQSGATQQGVRLLARALGDGQQVQWPGRASAEADYALGLLMIGNTKLGVAKLAEAQRRFESEGEVELLAKSLWNELQYLEHADGEAGQVKAVKKRLTSMQL